MRFAAFALAGALLLPSFPGRAGEIAELAAMAEQQAQAGQYLDAIGTLDEAQAKLWDQSPLLIRKAFFVASEPGGFGMYDLRENNVFKPGDKLTVYAEPVGYGFKPDNEMFVLNLGVAVELQAKDGTSLGSKSEFGRIKLRSRVRNREFFTTLTYSFSGLSPGDYQVATTLTDAATGKRGSFTLPFTIVQ